MALFARRDQVQEQNLWTDGMGRVGTRSAQLLLILTLLSVSVYVMLQLQLLVIPVLIALGVGVVMTFIATRTRFGRYVFAMGGNPEAAELAGINTKRLTMYIFTLMGFLVGVSACISSARLKASTVALGQFGLTPAFLGAKHADLIAELEAAVAEQPEEAVYYSNLAGALELARWGQSTGLASVLVTSALASSLHGRLPILYADEHFMPVAMRFQQLTGPAMAKGVEDTAFYRYYPLASLNEVGGDPSRFGVLALHDGRQ